MTKKNNQQIMKGADIRIISGRQQDYISYNPDFNAVDFDGFRKEAGLNRFTLAPKQWIEKSNAIGFVSKVGCYRGTYAHKDIAFRFLLTDSDMEILKSQIVMSNDNPNLKSQFATSNWGGRRTKPYVFTEQGVAMLSAVLKSETAVKVRNRFAIIDNTTIYHFGASLKDLGKKWFAFSKMDFVAVEMLARLGGMK